MKWRLLIEGRGSPAWNMAEDEALLRHVQLPVLRIYGWNVPAVSVGYFQSLSDVPAGRPFVRRYTGGGLVDHAFDVTYTVVMPRSHPIFALPTAESYGRLHAAVVQALNNIGVHSLLAPCCDMNESNACFEKAVRFDVVADNRKLAGAAQRRTREGMLHQGSVVLPDPVLNDRLIQALPDAFRNAIPCELEDSTLSDGERATAERLEKERYSTSQWNEQK